MNDRKEGGFGFNERSIILACMEILSAYRLAPFKPCPTTYFPAGWFQAAQEKESTEKQSMV